MKKRLNTLALRMLKTIAWSREYALDQPVDEKTETASEIEQRYRDHAYNQLNKMVNEICGENIIRYQNALSFLSAVELKVTWNTNDFRDFKKTIIEVILQLKQEVQDRAKEALDADQSQSESATTITP